MLRDEKVSVKGKSSKLFFVLCTFCLYFRNGSDLSIDIQCLCCRIFFMLCFYNKRSNSKTFLNELCEVLNGPKVSKSSIRKKGVKVQVAALLQSKSLRF